ncbi:hypothetical protein CERZMDRAFT_34385 [Cercospora zeae-maydis SCOH1-5]|uniref:Ribosomal protein S15 n=1 Tax=Cercospora zeae-maydis SCOH1-5 TaxID=717836 RepID=A0A6A6FR78_9PEZI|nr:hypothetical protein CERZMDRAFT_34385 [Cercospora zeae-maydis SCOH1-5]
MPPRIPIAHCLRAQSTTPSPTVARSFSSGPCSQASTVTQRRKHRDPYAIAQARAKKAANLSRQEVLKKERASSLGDPVRGLATPFVHSFDTALPPGPSAETPSTQVRNSKSPSRNATRPKTETDNHLNFYLTKEELARGIGKSQWLITPVVQDEPEEGEGKKAAQDDGGKDSSGLIDDIQEEEHATAQEALRRISSLALGSSKDRLRVNKQRCIDVFGRHNTEQTLPPKPRSAGTTGGEQQKVQRIGPDSGSSEVQIAILTAKIRAVADFLETRGTMDKVNKRNLRLLVHRRAKLLKYLRKKDRGGPRWQNLVETLGLTDGTWKGEITM